MEPRHGVSFIRAIDRRANGPALRDRLGADPTDDLGALRPRKPKAQRLVRVRAEINQGKDELGQLQSGTVSHANANRFPIGAQDPSRFSFVRREYFSHQVRCRHRDGSDHRACDSVHARRQPFRRARRPCIERVFVGHAASIAASATADFSASWPPGLTARAPREEWP